MKETKEFERALVHARSVERMYVLTLKVDEDHEKISLAGVGGECPASFDMQNGGALLGRACVEEIEGSADVISLIDGVIHGPIEEITFNTRGTLIRSKFRFNDGTRIAWGRVLFTRGRRTEVVRYPPYPRRA